MNQKTAKLLRRFASAFARHADPRMSPAAIRRDYLRLPHDKRAACKGEVAAATAEKRGRQ